MGQTVGDENDGENLVTGVAIDEDEIDTSGSVSTTVFHLTYDFPKGEGDSEENTLADIVGSEYFLKRIVGKFYAAINPPDAEPWTPYRDVLVGLGFFVARADHDNANPIGLPTMSLGQQSAEYSPLVVNTMREPWIWRRTWILSLMSATTPAVGATIQPGYPRTTAGYGSVLDGPHIDAKTKRRIRQDDRLFAAVSNVSLPFRQTAGVGGNPASIAFHLDYRLFGALRKAKNAGAF